MAFRDPRDLSRTDPGRKARKIEKFRRPPEKSKWAWLTAEMVFSPAYRTLSKNAHSAYWRIYGEYLSMGLQKNGELIVTHAEFRRYGVTGDMVGDAVDELQYKGLVAVTRGRAASGTPHPNLYRLTHIGDCNGGAATNDWKNCDQERADRWQSEIRALKAKERAKKHGRKKNPRSVNTESARSVNPESVGKIA